ncbi:MAG: 4Fe-4S ferredoxin [Planctomycetes bacterium]|nr:4Fe-4S ferredoxin [Planctomycetota bacterium]
MAAETAAPPKEKRKRKPKQLAVITDCCTGCAGSPVCVELCPVDNCMNLIHDGRNGPFGYIWVDPMLCIGCKKCVTKGPEDIFLEGCPWNAIEMVETDAWERQHGIKLPS